VEPRAGRGAPRPAGPLSISRETIYRHVWRGKRAGGLLHTHLWGAGERRRERYGASDSRGRLAGKRVISERPAEVEARGRVGHREAAAVMGAGSKDRIAALVGRETGPVLIGRPSDRTAGSLSRRVISLMGGGGGESETVAADNGTGSHGCERIERLTGVVFHFARPYHWWGRGGDEDADGLIRQYLPRGGGMAGLSQRQCNAIALKLNTRPRKRLGLRTPLECYDES